MRATFVVQLGPETRPAERRFEGWVGEVACCTDLRFRSTEELLRFLGQQFEAILIRSNEAGGLALQNQRPPSINASARTTSTQGRTK
jgi:hypothetical protein